MQRDVLRPVIHLKTRAQFEAVMAGDTISRTAHFALHRAWLDAPVKTAPAGPGLDATDVAPRQALFVVPGVWVGTIVPKRWAKRAVTRNAIKRQIYAVTEDLSAQLPVAAHVVRLRAAFAKDQFPSATSDVLKKAVRLELQQLMKKAVLQ